MKISIKLLLLITLIFVSFSVSAARLESGEEKNISAPVNDNLYIAGGVINIDAIIQGDLVAAGGLVSINDTVFEDLIVAGGDILVNAYIGGDARIAGENIKILESINGDLIVAGAYIQIDKNVTISGDLIIICGFATINGTVNGDIRFLGGKLSFNGTALGEADIKSDELTMNGNFQGPSTIVANTIALEKDAKFHNEVAYWQEDGELDFGPYMVSGQATYDEALAIEEEVDLNNLGGLMVALWILYTLSMLLIIGLLVFLFNKTFSKAGEDINHSYLPHFGYGAAYFVGIPMLTLFLLATLIGIPLGLVTLHLFLFSLLFAHSITAVILAYGMNVRYVKEWSKWKIMLIAALLFLAMKVLLLIPLLGSLVNMVLVAIAFGTLVAGYFARNRTTQKEML